MPRHNILPLPPSTKELHSRADYPFRNLRNMDDWTRSYLLKFLSITHIFFVLLNNLLGRLNSWVVSHSALIIGTLHHAQGCEFEPQWWPTLFWIQAQHLRFIYDSIWFIWFDTIICQSNLSCELWNRKLKIKEIFLQKKFRIIGIG